MSQQAEINVSLDWTQNTSFGRQNTVDPLMFTRH